MKPELAVLPTEVWIDVFVFPWITRRQLAQIVHRFRNRKFAEKLQFRLHDMGKQTLNYLDISSKHPNGPAKLITATDYKQFAIMREELERCEFPESEMPENIKAFKELSISHLDDQVLAFLDKIKPTFANVFVRMVSILSAEKAENLRILLDHLFPMFASIRGFDLRRDGIEFLGLHFPEHLTRAKTILLDLALTDILTFIPACLDWLSAPHNFGGPRFLKIVAVDKTFTAIVDAVRKQFLAATAPSTFVIFLEFIRDQNCADEESQNGVTNEQLSIRKATTTIQHPQSFSRFHYVEIVRHPTGGAAQMREWLNEREKREKSKIFDTEYGYGAKQVISITPLLLTIGQITKKNEKTGAQDQVKDKSTDHDDGKDAAGPSTSQSAKK